MEHKKFLELLFDFISSVAFVAWLGALVGHVLSGYSKDFVGTKPFFQKIIPNKRDSVYHFLDFLILPLFGCLLSVMLLEPTNIRSAMTAGLTWSGTFIALLKKQGRS